MRRAEAAGGGSTAGKDRLRTADFDYQLPPERIAQEPPAERDAARMLVLERRSGKITHASVRSLPGWLRAGDLVVVNDTRVVPARLRGRSPGGGGVEVLLLRELAPQRWEAMGRPGRRLRAGSPVEFPHGCRGTVEEQRGEGRIVLRIEGLPVRELLERAGETPLPPYIRRRPNARDRERYQTVYAANPGAVAAPTAGLHLTPRLLEALAEHGVGVARLTLHVGPGTFRPVRVEDPACHAMEGEEAFVPEETAEAVARTRAAGGRVVAIGTTTVRALESRAAAGGTVRPGRFVADAFILPGFRFRVVDALLTNFHLPKSTLLMLVAAFAGREVVLAAYRCAVREGYRFYSYGDAMLIL